MSDYPSTSPFGPHGPQTNGYSVTPNPTAQSSFANIGGGSYDGYSQPTSFSGGYAQPTYTGYTGGAVYVPRGPSTRSKVVGFLLAFFLGPIGMLYGVWSKSALHWIAFLAFTAFYTYEMVATDESQPIVLTFNIVCAAWSTIAIVLRNRIAKREWDATAAAKAS